MQARAGYPSNEHLDLGGNKSKIQSHLCKSKIKVHKSKPLLIVDHLMFFGKVKLKMSLSVTTILGI